MNILVFIIIIIIIMLFILLLLLLLLLSSLYHNLDLAPAAVVDTLRAAPEGG